jgi:hypothetical protein
MKVSVLQKGNVLFFYRPKVQHDPVPNLEDVQHFFMVLKPELVERFIFVVMGRKKLPEKQSFFGFVEKISDNLDQAISFLSEDHYTTSTSGERTMPAACCIGIGKYLLIDHGQHTDLVYELSKPHALGRVQKEFHLKKYGNYLITVKNPKQPAPRGVGLSNKQKAKYPGKLQNLFQDYRFIPLNPAEFLEQEGAELLLIGKTASTLGKNNHEISMHFQEINSEDVLKRFEKYFPIH